MLIRVTRPIRYLLYSEHQGTNIEVTQFLDDDRKERSSRNGVMAQHYRYIFNHQYLKYFPSNFHVYAEVVHLPHVFRSQVYRYLIYSVARNDEPNEYHEQSEKLHCIALRNNPGLQGISRQLCPGNTARDNGVIPTIIPFTTGKG